MPAPTLTIVEEPAPSKLPVPKPMNPAFGSINCMSLIPYP